MCVNLGAPRIEKPVPPHNSNKMNSSVGIFDTLVERQLTGTWLKRKADLDRQKYQPYADLLLDEVVWPEVYAKSDEIAASLTAKCSTASAHSELFVPIWSFNHVNFRSKNRILSPLHDSPYTENLARMGNKDALFIQQVHQNKWLQWLEVNLKGAAQWEEERVLYRESIERVIRKSDFLEQLAVKFGRNFRCTLVPKQHHRVDENYWAEMEIQLHFFPKGLPDHHAKRRQEHLRSVAERERRTLAANEALECNAKKLVPLRLLGGDDDIFGEHAMRADGRCSAECVFIGGDCHCEWNY